MSILAGPHRSADWSKRLDDGLHRFVDALALLLRWPQRVHANRKLMGRMARMSDSELLDIGLTRGDLADSAALPMDRELGSFLAERAGYRRRARHRA